MGHQTTTKISPYLVSYLLTTYAVWTVGLGQAVPSAEANVGLDRVRRGVMCVTGCSCNSATATVTCIWPSLDAISGVPVGTSALSFRGGKLTKVPRGTFANFASLKTLHLDQNNIKTLADGSFTGLSNLRRLTLSRNALWVIPRNSFRGLQRVSRLDLSKNRISVLSSYVFTGLASLMTLDLRDNPVSFITENAFAGVTAIKQLYLRGCRVTNIAHITKPLRTLLSLQTLQLQSLQISYLPTKAIPFLPNLTSVDLSYWKGLRRIHPFAFSGLNLKTLSLKGGSLTGVPSQAILKIPSLVNLSLSGNPIRYIQPYDFNGLNNLQNLYLKSLNILDVREMGFIGLDSLGFLDLTGNPQLQPLRRKVFGSLKTVVSLNVTGSTWKCDCNLKWFAATPNVNIKRITCNSPPLWRNKNLFTYLKTRAYDNLMTCSVPIVAARPSALNATMGQNTKLSCYVSSGAASTINWVAPNKRVILSGLPWGRVSMNQTSRSVGTLTIKNVTAADAGKYVCLAYNGGGNRTSTVDLKVVPIVPTPPASSLRMKHAYTKENFILSCLIGSLLFLGAVVGCYSIIFPCSRMCQAQTIAIKIDMPETTLSPEQTGGRKGNVSANMNIQRSTL
ncbi:leucine-rich repeat and immunoglobulin-like domain-containing nogo receptor-interacting protein 3 [Branchiostoma lanceolatum]|uniref:leucine-rich repeat and immunoglobulin-like domain-containing nogo receptor-interacting protein 3 n=1 Tax=Branchiostoma lanceolatum TaxID=7740 RepID=UPI003456ECC1